MPQTLLRSRATPRLAALTLACLLAAGAVHAGTDAAAKAYDDALKAYEKQDLNAAALLLKNAIQEDNKLLAAHVLFGKVLMARGEMKGAEAAFEEALKQGVSKAEIAPFLGRVYLLAGEPRKVLESIPVTGLPPALQAQIQVMRGSAHAMMGNQAQATESFNEARKLDPKSAEPDIAEAPQLLRTGARDKAKAMALRATQLAPTNGFAWYQLGNVQQNTGDLPGALASYDKAISLAPKHADSHVARATALLSMGRKDEAEKVLAMLKETKAKDPRAAWLRGMFAQERGDADLAKAEFTEVINQIDPMPPALRNGNEPVLLAGALSHYGLGNREKTREYLDAILGRNSKHGAAMMLLATVLVDAGDYAKALPLLENLSRANPESQQVQYLLGSVYLARKQYDKAAEVLDKASRQGRNNSALRELSFAQLGLGQAKLGLANLERAYAANPKDLRAGIELAVYYARNGQGPKAVQVADALVKLDPANLAMLNFLGNVKGRLGDRKGQREAYQAALTKDPKFRQVVANMSWLDMDEGKLDDVRERLKTFLRDNPKDAEVMLQLGLLEQRANRPAEALALFQQGDGVQTRDMRPGLAAVEQQLAMGQNEAALAAARTLVGKYPNAVQPLLVLARAQLQSADRTQAKTTLNEATKLAGFDPVPLAQIGRLQLAAGNLDGASHAAAKAVQGSPDDPTALMLGVEVAARRGNAAEVDKAFSALQARHPNLPGTLITGGHIAMSRQQFAKAITSYRSAFEREPSSPVALLVSQAMLANKEADKALALLDGWSKRNPKDMTALRALAEVQVAAGKADAAKATYATVMAAQPDDPTVVAAYARLLQALKDPAATATAEKAYKMAPQNTALADGYGWMLVEKGDVDAGVRVLREARLRDPANPGLRWHLAAGLAKAGRKTEARDELQAALSANMPAPVGVDAARLKSEIGL